MPDGPTKVPPGTPLALLTNRQKVVALHAQGLTHMEIGLEIGLSASRVGQILGSERARHALAEQQTQSDIKQARLSDIIAASRATFADLPETLPPREWARYAVAVLRLWSDPHA